MELEFLNISIPRPIALEMHRALLARHIMEVLLRRERGLEEVDEPPILRILEKSLGISSKETHRLYHDLEDELWEYGWYSFTDEWAWHRARAEVLKELGKKAEPMKREAIDRLIEERYEKEFERYVTEIDMQETTPKSNRAKKSRNQ